MVMKYNKELVILPLFDTLYTLPVSPIPNYRVTVNAGGLSFDIELDTYYPSNKTSLSIKYQDKYLISKISLKYYVNYALLDNRIEGAIFLAPITLPIKKDINYSDFGININLMYGIITHEIPA